MDNLLKYRVGALFYVPALNKTAVDKIIQHKFDRLTSCCFCLEDSIQDSALAEAENILLDTLTKIQNEMDDDLPNIFIRVRNPGHLLHIHKKFESVHSVITGYNLPKFDLNNAEDYASIIKNINTGEKVFYVMPILESRMIADICTRTGTLQKIKEIIDTMHDYVLNIRLGGNDFCNLYGLRRNVNQTIYDIGVIRDIITDIINVFSFDYVVSGPVWEYFGKKTDDGWADGPWKEGLNRELALDRLNGIIGKTAIHPSQLPIIYDSLRVTKEDYEDACRILNWKPDGFAVEKGATSRMNEVKCHRKWAKRIKALGDIYGVK